MAGSNPNGMSSLYTFYHNGAKQSKRDDNSLPKIVGMNTTSSFGLSSSVLDDSQSLNPILHTRYQQN
jgi:hypothetical protein